MQDSPDRAHEVLERLLLAHEAYFDVERGYEYAGHAFDGYAEFHSSASQYVLAKRAKLWETNSHEYMFFAVRETLDVAEFEKLVAFMTEEAINKVVLERDHMSSYLTLVVIADEVEEGLAHVVRKTRFRRNFALGLKGWADLRVCVVCLDEGMVLSNAMGKDIAPTLRANAFEVA